MTQSKDVTDAALVLGATMRLTRLITNDDLGQWWLKDPLDRWMHGHDVLQPGEHEERARLLAEGKDLAYVDALLPVAERLKYHRYLHGLECPHCVGTWVGFGVLTSYVVAKRSRRALAAWRFVATGLSLNTASVAAGDAIKYWD